MLLWLLVSYMFTMVTGKVYVTMVTGKLFVIMVTDKR